MTSQPLDSLDPVSGPVPEAPGVDPAGVPAAGLGRGPADDDSNAEIDQYMQELLSRVNRRSPGTGNPRPEPPQSAKAELPHRSVAVPRVAATERATPASVPPVTPAAADAQDQAVPLTKPDPAPPATPAPQPPPDDVLRPDSARPRTTPPERDHNMAALRQLANHSAQDAIAAYECRQMVRRAYGKLAVATLATVASILLFLMSSTSWSVPFFASLFALAVAVVWGSHNLLLWVRAWWKRRGVTRAERAAAD